MCLQLKLGTNLQFIFHRKKHVMQYCSAQKHFVILFFIEQVLPYQLLSYGHKCESKNLFLQEKYFFLHWNLPKFAIWIVKVLSFTWAWSCKSHAHNPQPRRVQFTCNRFNFQFVLYRLSRKFYFVCSIWLLLLQDMSSRFCGLFDYQTALGNQIPILLIFEKLHVGNTGY